jgi:hypothetical protein
VLGKVASCLGRHGVSIKRMNQDTPGAGEPIDMVIMTERTAEAKVRAAVAEVDTFDLALMPTHRFRILDSDDAQDVQDPQDQQVAGRGSGEGVARPATQKQVGGA